MLTRLSKLPNRQSSSLLHSIGRIIQLFEQILRRALPWYKNERRIRRRITRAAIISINVFGIVLEVHFTLHLTHTDIVWRVFVAFSREGVQAVQTDAVFAKEHGY